MITNKDILVIDNLSVIIPHRWDFSSQDSSSLSCGLKWWLRSRKVVDNVSLSVQQGEKLGLFGSSGAGKSVLLDTIAGYHRFTGTIETCKATRNKECLFQREKIVASDPKIATLNWRSVTDRRNRRRSVCRLLSDEIELRDRDKKDDLIETTLRVAGCYGYVRDRLNDKMGELPGSKQILVC